MSAQGALRDGAGAGFDLIETMRWEPVAGFVRLERHLARLHASARQLDFKYDPGRIGEVLENTVGGHESALRTRLLQSSNGDVSVSVQPYEPLPPDKVWSLRIARIRLDSADPLLAHKTSRRTAFVSARSEFLVEQADEVLMLNERGEVCEGTITNVFVELSNGRLLTPARSCGLLPGVLRAELLDEDHASEAVLYPSDLKGSNVCVGNSLRGLIPARLAG